MWKFLLVFEFLFQFQQREDSQRNTSNRKMLSEGLVVSSQCQEMKFRDATLLAISEIALCSTLAENNPAVQRMS